MPHIRISLENEKWGILGDDDEKEAIQLNNNESDALLEDGEIDIDCICPLSATTKYSSYLKKNTEDIKKFGYHKISKLELADLDTAVPILLWFHGGGMFIGKPRDIFYSLFARLLVEKEYAKKKSKEIVAKEEKDVTVPPFIVLSVNYRLAPEYPFPAAIVDSLAVTSFVLESFPTTTTINIGGISAGGNLAVAVSLECCRRYPGRLKR